MAAVTKGKKPEFWLKAQIVLQESQEEFLVGVCDKELLGKTLGYFKVSEHFFKGELVDLEKAIAVLKKATIGNIVGKNITAAALKEKLITNAGIKKEKDIPHSQIIRV